MLLPVPWIVVASASGRPTLFKKQFGFEFQLIVVRRKQREGKLRSELELGLGDITREKLRTCFKAIENVAFLAAEEFKYDVLGS